ncbi:hypothetical protein [Streptomyces sp. NPDC056160]|uniref:hypothetical protein n=1 Tax=Streptomyces sp. NPDC056160 TaxID=3345731 RepID=UPI0035DE91AF
MTPHQVLAVAALGGFAAIVSLLVFAFLAVAVYAAVARLFEIREARREQHRDLKTCRAIHALGTFDRQGPK